MFELFVVCVFVSECVYECMRMNVLNMCMYVCVRMRMCIITQMQKKCTYVNYRNVNYLYPSVAQYVSSIFPAVDVLF